MRMATAEPDPKPIPCELSILIVVGDRHDPVEDVYTAYRDALRGANRSYEFVYVLDGEFPDVATRLHELQASGEPIVIVELPRTFGESTAVTAGVEHCQAESIMTLPAYLQIAPEEVGKLASTEFDNNDMIVCRRWPRSDSLFNRTARRIFHWPIKWISGLDLHDLGCSARLFRRRIFDEVRLYGDQHRFLPLLAYRQGFHVVEIDARQAPSDTSARLYSPRIYMERALDLLSMFFLIRFTRKPLRFFGLIGSVSFGFGSLMLLILGIQRLFFDIPLANRPVLLLASLLVVLGFQFFAIGLIGEIIIFTQSRATKEYTVEKVVRYD